MARDRSTRRRFLSTFAATVGAGLAGCAAPEGTSFGARRPTDTVSDGAATGNQFSRVYREIVDSVVMVRTYGAVGRGQGSGFVVADGRVITNQHVIANAETVDVRFTQGEWRSGRVVGSDPYADLAVLEVQERPGYASPLSFTEAPVFVGQEVVALGHPFGLASSVSAGIVSGVNRVLPAPNNFLIPATIQTTAAVNPGNSGGPLATLAGDVAGVVTAGGGENVGFAIGVRLARRVIPALVETGTYEHSYVGARLREVTPTIAAANDLAAIEGVLIDDVEPEGPADGVLRGSDGSTIQRGERVPVGGDVIVTVDERSIRSIHDLSTYLALETSPGDEIGVTVVRDGERQTVSLTLGTRPPPR